MRLLILTMDTRINGEDLALTPYLFFVGFSGTVIKVYGIGLCWGYFAFSINIGFGVPKQYPTFKHYSKNKEQDAPPL